MRNEENEKYMEHMKKMKNLQDSKRNMRVDMRPKVVVKTMGKELILGVFALICAVSKIINSHYKYIKACLFITSRFRKSKSNTPLNMKINYWINKSKNYSKDNNIIKKAIKLAKNKIITILMIKLVIDIVKNNWKDRLN